MNKAFTLMELLAVIVLIALLSLLTVTTVSKQFKDSKSVISSSQNETIKMSAQMWGSENKSLIETIDSCASITVGFLKDEGYIDIDIKNPATNEKISDNTYINIRKTNSKYTYEVQNENSTKCSELETGEI